MSMRFIRTGWNASGRTIHRERRSDWLVVRIVVRIEEQLSAIGALRAAIERAQRRSAIERAKHRSASLRRAVLERAFRGELVRQDPADEPAELLLARIRAERDASPPKHRVAK